MSTPQSNPIKELSITVPILPTQPSGVTTPEEKNQIKESESERADFKAAKQSSAVALADSRPIYRAHMLTVSLQATAVYSYCDAWLPDLMGYISTDASMPGGRLL